MNVTLDGRVVVYLEGEAMFEAEPQAVTLEGHVRNIEEPRGENTNIRLDISFVGQIFANEEVYQEAIANSLVRELRETT